MRYVIMVICALVLSGVSGAGAQELTALARVDPQRSHISDGWFGNTTLNIALSQGVPFRVFHLDNPKRLVIDFREADWSGVDAKTLLPEAGKITAVRFGPFRPGWSRLVMDMAEPLLPSEIEMKVDESTGIATLSVALKGVAPEAFGAGAGSPKDVAWATQAAQPPVLPKFDNSFVVVIDPGHGGVDPGAVRDGIEEKDIMLKMAQALAEALRRSGQADVVLTRTIDQFVSLPGRVDVAHAADADLFISLHADILSEGGASGATVYTLADDASDEAAAQLAAQHNRADILAGADLNGADDEVAGVLLDLARQETAPRSDQAAATIIGAMQAAGGPMNAHPSRQAGFSVLTSADVPSILIEVGFLSSKRDLANLRDPVWRAVMASAIADGILAWRTADLAQRPLVRQ
ncbi:MULTISPECIES: N-acetylmuramoyl-L-alanine amidase [Roseobacteraceae]|uniref:N-acetylmuramoyl-L-alanine amidase n=1 Tax=Pseudosulfitobacter pseudonitzschiae TaxID=1402135 RepID=A0A221JZP3_9RHOB|nr:MULTISPECIES: N-acetylmuramoyl-L-alanine amidase [Roseobacteraceae]ASM72057.1 N-acetylmuramoyl-L-alanine amidase AmiA [Pseudosulfitobacter pseudonitzschiae]